jgi:hypothetical protein
LCLCVVKGTQLIEQTGKLWKVVQVLGAITAVVGTVIVSSAMASGGENGADRSSAIGGAGVLATGLVVFLCGRIGAWWHHG